MSLIEEALRRQQEQERQRTPEAPAAATSGAPLLPPATAATAPSHDVPHLENELSDGKKSAQPLLALVGVLALVGLAVGLLWWFLAQSLPALSPRTKTARTEPPKNTTNQTDIADPPRVVSTGTSALPHAAIAFTPPAAPVVPGTATNLAAGVVAPLIPLPTPEPALVVTATVAVAGSNPEPSPRPKPTPAAPMAPWPKFTLKGRVAFGNSYALMLGNGQVLEVGDTTADGIQLVSATQDRVRLTYKGQTRDYRLQAGTFVLLPASDPEPPVAE